MAVTISSKFYQEDEWKDISKIVFTSPNMDSPNVAGTRSHILPGEGDLALWYEDTSEMFRIEPAQVITVTDFYEYKATNTFEVDVTTSSGVIYLHDMYPSDFVTYINNVAGIPSGDASDISYEIKNIYVADEILSYETKMDLLQPIEGGYYTVKDDGWNMLIPTLSPATNMILEFNYPVKISAFSLFENFRYNKVTDSICKNGICTSYFTGEIEYLYRYFIGNFSFSGSNDRITWTTLISNQTAPDSGDTILTFNDDNYLYYKIDLHSAPDSPLYDANYYGLGQIVFYQEGFTLSQGTETLSAHVVNDNGQLINLYIEYAESITDPTPEITQTSTDITVSGISSVIVTASGTDYINNLNSILDTEDYITSALCTSSTVSGTGTSTDFYVYSAVDGNVYSDNMSATTKFVNDVLVFTSTSVVETEISTETYTGNSVTTYTTIVSGTLISGTSEYNTYGTTNRSFIETLYERANDCKITVNTDTSTSGIINVNNELNIWGWQVSNRPLDMDTTNSIIFETTFGEAYDCRLTAWDDTTHSTIINELIQGDHVRVSAVAYCCTGSKLDPGLSEDPINTVFPPVRNRILKGNTIVGQTPYYYGDFNMKYRYQDDIFGDFLMFKPMLYGIDNSIPYGVHDFIITLHYNYT